MIGPRPPVADAVLVVDAALVTDNPFAVEHERSGIERARDLDDFRHARRDVVEVPREHAHLVTVAVHLDSSAVELPFDRRAPDRRQRIGDRGRARGEHRLDGTQHLQAHREERGFATRERTMGSVGEVPAE